MGAEKFLAKKKLTAKNIAQAADLTMQAARPIDDVRGSASYRKEMVKIITSRALKALHEGTEKELHAEEANPSGWQRYRRK